MDQVRFSKLLARLLTSFTLTVLLHIRSFNLTPLDDTAAEGETVIPLKAHSHWELKVYRNPAFSLSKAASIKT